VHGPQHEAIRDVYVELRYKLLPYNFTNRRRRELGARACRLCGPVFLDYPQAEISTATTEIFFLAATSSSAPVHY